MNIVKESIARNMAKFGSPVLTKESVYDWQDPWAINHILGIDPATTYENFELNPCSWISPENPKLEELFVTTSGGYGDTETQKMIQMRDFSCKCGEYTGTTLRYAGEHSEFLIALMNDEES